MAEKNLFVHETSFIDDNVELGNNTYVWHFSHIIKGTVTGESCSFGQNCVIGPDVKIGDRVKVQNNISIFDRVEIGDDVLLGPSVVFANAINRRSFICRKFEMKTTKIDNGVSVGANATIVRGSQIGQYALVNAGSVVNGDVKPYEYVSGNPASHEGWVSRAGNFLTFDENNIAVDDFDNSKYKLENDFVTEI